MTTLMVMKTAEKPTTNRPAPAIGRQRTGFETVGACDVIPER